MAWDANRPVPWQRLFREWLIYVAIMAVVLILFFRNDNLIGVFAGLLVSGPLYLGFGYVLAKFGYQRRTLKELREEPKSDRGRSTEPDHDRPRPKPPPTKRTGGGGGRPGGSRQRRR